MLEKLTDPQKQALDAAQTAVARCNAMALKVEALGLPVLAAFLREASCMIRVGIDYQERAFRDNALLQPAQRVLDPEKQADAIAAAIQRKGLLK